MLIMMLLAPCGIVKPTFCQNGHSQGEESSFIWSKYGVRKTKRLHGDFPEALLLLGSPKGVRTPVTGLRTRFYIVLEALKLLRMTHIKLDISTVYMIHSFPTCSKFFHVV
jgi:hypothetical protein